MPRTMRDNLKQKRNAIYNGINRIDVHLYEMAAMTEGKSEVVNDVTSQCLHFTVMYREAMKALLQTL